MKHWLMAAALICFGSSAQAAPYFRVLDINSPHTSMGAYVDPVNPGRTSAGTSLALITHSPKDGCLLPGITCENWSPLAIDFSANGGQALFGFGPSANLAPMVRKALAALVPWKDRYVTASDLAILLEPSDGSIDIAFGPKFMICPEQNWKGYFRIAAGVAWSW